jgi:hypothetical protein
MTRNVLRGEMRKTMLRWLVAAMAAGVVLVALFKTSVTRDAYVCHSCKGFGNSTALRVFRHRLVWSPVRLTLSLTGRNCRHTWVWNSASSHGWFFNRREDWDGPIGSYPYLRELEEKLTENQASQAIGAPGAPQPER